MICPACGVDNLVNSRFCQNCGVELPPPPAPVPAPQPAPAAPCRGLAIAALVFGLVSFLCFPAMITAPMAIVFGAVAKGQGNKSSMATAGIVCGIICLVLLLMMLAMMFSVYGFAINSLMDATQASGVIR